MDNICISYLENIIKNSSNLESIENAKKWLKCEKHYGRCNECDSTSCLRNYKIDENIFQYFSPNWEDEILRSRNITK